MKLLCLFLSFFCLNSSFGLTAKEVYKQSLKYVGFVTTPQGSGTGFFLKNGIFATNVHVIKDSAEKDIVVELPDGKKLQRPVRIYLNSNEDIAFLFFEGGPKGFTISEKFEIADKVYVLGNPKDYKFSITDGLISRLSETDNIQTIQFTAPILPGSSGSPILNESGEVIGIVHSRLRNEQGFGFGTGVKNFISALSTTTKLLENYTSLAKECRSFSASCLKLGELLSEAGLFQASLGVFEQACKKKILKACYEVSTLKLTLGSTGIDDFLKEIKDLCLKGEHKSCETESTLKDKTHLANNVLRSKGFEIIFPKTFQIYHKDVWVLVKDEFLRNVDANSAYQFGGWVTKTSFFTGKTSDRVYAFIENIPLNDQILSIFRDMSFKEVPEYYKEIETKALEERYKKAEVTVKKVKNSFPYYFVLETKYKSGGLKKDLYLFGDNAGVVRVTFSGANSESKNMDLFIKQTIKGISVKDKSYAIVFDANKKFRVISYVLIGCIVVAGILFFLQKRYNLITRIYSRSRVV